MKRILTTLLLLILATLACVTQPATSEPSVPSSNVETVVAQTMDAITASAPVSPTETSTPPSETSGLLPHSLYFLNTDSAGFLQIYRLETDGETIGQITFESSDVNSYDVSPVDGSVAYVSNNQLLLVNADGSGRRMLVDGGPLESDESYITSAVNQVAWSPDGKTIAFGYGGLNFFALETGAINKVLENQVDDSAGFSILREGYVPNEYSPDGSILLVEIRYYEGGVYAMYHLGGKTLVRSEDNPVTCCDGSWAPDGSAYYAASPYLGMISPGLWRIHTDGKVDTLLSGEAPGSLDFALSPIIGPDGQLYFFHNTMTTDDMISRLPLYMVRSEPDGVTGRTNLIPTSFDELNEVLWAPDASFAVLAIAPAENIFQGGKAEIHYTDGSPAVPLLPFARDMRWGP